MTKFTIEMRTDGSVSFEVDRVGLVTTPQGIQIKERHNALIRAAMMAVLEVPA